MERAPGPQQCAVLLCSIFAMFDCATLSHDYNIWQGRTFYNIKLILILNLQYLAVQCFTVR